MDKVSQETERLKEKLLLKQNKKLPFFSELHKHKKIKTRW